MKIGKYLEHGFLVFLLGMLLWVSIGTLWDFRISHDFPFGYQASDAFQHQVRAESILDMGNYLHEAPYISGGFTDAVGFYPPVLNNIAVLLSTLSGVEVYDTILFLVFLFVGLSVLLFYFIMKRFGKHYALLGVPLAFLLFSQGPASGPGPFSSITWGNWPAYMGHFFLICFFWYLTNKDLQQSWIFLAVFVSSLAFAHQSELIFAFVFFVVYFVYRLVKKKLSREEMLDYLKAAGVVLVVSFYFLVVFKFTWWTVQSTHIQVETSTTTEPTMYLSNFGIALAFLVLGMVVCLFLRKKKSHVVGFSFFMLIIGLANYIGFSRHAWRTRDLWPLYLALFFGVGLYFLVSRIYRKWSLRLSYGLSVFMVLAFSGILIIPFVPHVQSFTSPGIMTGGHWESLLWLRENVAADEKILFVYGDLYDQNALLRNTFKPPYHVHSREYTAALQNRTVKRNIRIMLLGDRAGVHYAYRKSFFEYGYYYREYGKDYFYNTERDMCDFEYYVMDKVSRQPALAQYNLFIANLLVNNTFIAPVFDNGVVLVLKNDNPAGECLANETKF